MIFFVYSHVSIFNSTRANQNIDTISTQRCRWENACLPMSSKPMKQPFSFFIAIFIIEFWAIFGNVAIISSIIDLLISLRYMCQYARGFDVFTRICHNSRGIELHHSCLPMNAFRLRAIKININRKNISARSAFTR